MEKDQRMEIAQRRSYSVAKANEIIQKARYDLTLTELKVLSYLISLIKPTDTAGTSYMFSISDFCKVCGFDYNNGHNYERVKKALQNMRNKSLWVMQPDGSEVLIGWIGKVRISKRSGKILVRFDEDLQKYIMDLYSNYTQYELVATLPMQSRFSIRMYELLKSYQYKRTTFAHTFEINDLKMQLAAPYKNFKDFRIKVLEMSTKEINLYTDLEVSWEPIKEGRTVTEVRFDVRQSDFFDRMEKYEKTFRKLDGQMNIFDYKSIPGK